MGRKQIVSLFLSLIAVIALVSGLALLIRVPAPVLGWSYDGLGGGNSIQETSDGGYIIATSGNLVKIDAEGNLQWYKPISGSFVRQTSDGGYIVVGSSLVKTDDEGNTEWQQAIAGSRVQQTSDGGYIVVGSSLVKTDDEGTVEWEKPISGYWVQQAADGGYTIIGSSIVKTDGEGNTWWERPNDVGVQRQTSDGGYIGIGSTYLPYYGEGDSAILLTKLDANGDMQWESVFGGIFFVEGSWPISVEQTSDGGYAIYDGYKPASATIYPYHRVWKTDMNGCVQGCAYVSGDLSSDIRVVQQTSDGGYVCCGWAGGYDWSLRVEKIGAILGDAISQPVNVSPANGATGVDLYPTLGASTSSDPDAEYAPFASQWQVTTTSGDYSSPFCDSEFVLGDSESFSLDPWGFPPADDMSYSTDYYWRVRFMNGLGAVSPWSAETQFTTLDNPPPLQPYNSSPSNGATGVSLTPTLESSGFEDSYHDYHAASQWQVTTVSGDYSNPVFDSGTDVSHLTTITIPTGVLEDSTIYYWHVRYQDNYGAWSEFSAQTSFTTPNQLPNQPSNVSPANGVMEVSLTPTLQSSAFSDPDAGDTHAASRWQIRTSLGSYSSPVFDSDMDASHLTSINVPSGVLNGNTTYYWHVRHKDNHGDPSSWSTETSFTTTPVPPAVITNDASNVATTSATLKGTLDDLGSASTVTVSFVWGTTSGAYSNEATIQDMTSTGTFYFTLPSLIPGTTYYYKAKAVGDGTTYGEEKSFTTSLIPPSVTTYGASYVATTSARLNGDLTSLGTAVNVTVSFEYGTSSGAYGNETIPAEVMSTTGAFYYDLGSLPADTEFFYRAKAVGDGTVYGDEQSFITGTTPPTVTTGAATDVATTSAILNGILSSLGTAGTVDVSLQWGLTTSYGSVTASEAKTTAGTFTFSLTGLTAKTTYHFRAKAAGDGTAYGDDETFTTPVSATAPSVTTGSATSIGTSTATLNGNLTSLGTVLAVQVSFEWGTASDSYTNSTSPQGMTASGTFHFDLSGLSAGTTYYFRAKASGDGSAYGSQMSFTASTVSNQSPIQPSSASPANRAAGVSRTPVLQSSAFSDPDSGDTHTASRWQVSSTAGDYSAALFDSGADAGHLTSIGIPSALLQYSTTYYWRVRYEDNHGTWSPWSVEASFSTAAQPQADFSISSVGSSEGFIVVFFTNMSWGGVSPLTYAWDFENDGTIDATEREPWHRYSTSGTYTVSLKVRDAMGDTDSEVKANCLTILSSSGATVETTDGQVSAEFPSGAVTGAAMVTIGSTTSSGLPDMPKGLTKGDTCFVISALDESGNEIVTLSQPSVITVEYSEADLAAAGGDPNKLVLAYWDEAAGEWKPLETTVDTDDMTLSVSTKHLSTWAVLAKTTSASKGLPNWAWAPFVGIGAVALVLVLVYLAWFKKPAEQQ